MCNFISFLQMAGGSRLNGVSPTSLSALIDITAENETLRHRMREAIRISEEQKQHFRTNIEQLKQQLTETVNKRDALLAQK